MEVSKFKEELNNRHLNWVTVDVNHYGIWIPLGTWRRKSKVAFLYSNVDIYKIPKIASFAII